MPGPLIRRALTAGLPFLTPRQIAQELMAPTKKWHLIVIGDSRHTSMQRFALSQMSSVAWSGCMARYWGALDASGGAHDSTGQSASMANQAAISPWIAAGGRSTWFPTGGGFETKFSGTAEPSSGTNITIMRLGSADPLTQALHPLLWDALLAGGDTRIVIPYWKHTGAMSATPGARISWRATGTTSGAAGNLQSSYVYDMTGSGYGVMTLTIASGYDWGTYNAPFVELQATPGGATVANQTAAWFMPSIEKDGPGIVYYPQAMGGWAIEGAGGVGGWLDLNEISNSYWGDFFRSFVTDAMFWLDLGTNNSGSLTQAQHVAKMKQLIARIRVQWPGAPIVLTSAFASSTSGSNPYYRAAAAQLASEVTGVLYLDTYGAMPDYSTGSGLGYYGDTVHYSDTGNTEFFAKIDDMIVDAAA